MQKKFGIISIVTFIVGLVIGGTVIYFITKPENSTNATNENNEIVNNEEPTSNSLNLPTKGNDTILTTESNTTLRVVNE